MSCCSRRKVAPYLPPSEALNYLAEVSEHNPGAFTEAWFINARGLKLHAYAAKLIGEPRGIMIFHHGIRSHGLLASLNVETPGGRAKHVSGSIMELYLSEGFAFYTYDCEGHGLSKSTSNGEFFMNVWDLVDDLLLFSELVRKEHPKLPLFVCGISMGGGICLGAAVKKRDAFQGLIVAAPMISIEQVKKKGGNRCLVAIAPRLLQCVPCVRHWRLVSMSESPDPFERKTFKEDPLTEVKPRLLVGPSFACLVYCEELVKRLGDVTIPFLSIHASGDTVVDYESSQLLFDFAQSADKTLLNPPPGSGHGLFSECVCREWTRNTIRDWLKTRA